MTDNLEKLLLPNNTQVVYQDKDGWIVAICEGGEFRQLMRGVQDEGWERRIMSTRTHDAYQSAGILIALEK